MEFNQATESSFLNQGAQSFFNQPMDPFYNHQATTEPILNHSAESFFNNQAMTVDTTFHNNHHHQATTTTTTTESSLLLPFSPNHHLQSGDTLKSAAALRNPAAESFYLSEMRKLETEKKLWKKDEQMLNKEISRLTIRMQEEIERRTDHEFEKAHLHEQIEALHCDNDLLKMELCKKSDDLNKLRLKCADLENQINNSRQIQLHQRQLQQQQHQFAIPQQPKPLMDASSYPQIRSGRSGRVAAASHSSSSSPPTTNWAEICKSGSGGSEEDQHKRVVGGKSPSRRRVRDAESDFAQSSNSSFGSAKPLNKAASSSSSSTSTSSSSLSDDVSDGGGDDWLLESSKHGSSSATGGKTKKGKSSTLTRRKEVNFNNNVGSSNGKSSTLKRGEKASNQGNGKDCGPVDDLTALRNNIEVVNQKMAKNDKEIQKLENCVQCLTLKRDEGETSGST